MELAENGAIKEVMNKARQTFKESQTKFW